MFSRNTVFVLGAGASYELGFPLGKILAEQIAARVPARTTTAGDPSIGIARAMLENGLVGDDLWKYSSRIRQGILLSASIDDYLDQHQTQKSVIDLAKVTIAQIILETEAVSALRSNSGGLDEAHRTLLGETWLLPFGQMLLRGVRPSSLGEVFKRVRFISFNYDRSLERFLHMALEAALVRSATDVRLAIDSATIIHAYGSLGELPKPNTRGEGVGFGSSQGAPLNEIAARISTYTEAVEKNTAVRIRETMAWAEQIVFLGFGFHSQNMTLLRSKAGYPALRIVATSKGLSDIDRSEAHSRLRSLLDEDFDNFSGQLFLRDTSCVQLMRDFSLTLPS